MIVASFFIENQQTRRGRKPRNIKRDNYRLILSLLEFDRAFSASEISAKAKLSKTTVSKAFAELGEIGLLKYIGKGSSTGEGGKKPEMFALNSAYRYAVVILLAEPDSITCSVMDLACNVKATASAQTAPDVPYEKAVAMAAELARAAMEEAGVSKEQICGIAISCEGIVDTKTGVIRRPAHHRWPNNLHVREDVSKALGGFAEISIDNVCRYGGYAELLFEQNRKYENIVVIWNDELVGGCVLHDGQLVQGRGGLVGEFGHMVMEPNSDIRCSCGSIGCFEPLVSCRRVMEQAQILCARHPGSAIAEVARQRTLTMEGIFEAANQGDAFARQLLDPVIRYYAILIRNITNLSDPQKIILQGSYAHAGAYFYGALHKALRKFPLQAMVEDLVVQGSEYRDRNHRITGAGYHVITRFLNSNIMDTQAKRTT